MKKELLPMLILFIVFSVAVYLTRSKLTVEYYDTETTHGVITKFPAGGKNFVLMAFNSGKTDKIEAVSLLDTSCNATVFFTKDGVYADKFTKIADTTPACKQFFILGQELYDQKNNGNTDFSGVIYEAQVLCNHLDQNWLKK